MPCTSAGPARADTNHITFGVGHDRHMVRRADNLVPNGVTRALTATDFILA